MGFVTPRMSLQVWNASSDPYDHEQLADNFLKLDQHDHSQGRGSQIPGAGIQSGAITSDHIYPGSIGEDALAANSVGTDQLRDESVTNEKLHNNARVPVGMVMDWYCANPALAATFLPDGWRVCDGTSVPAGEHEIPGADLNAPFVLPNLIGRLVIGADPAKALNAVGSSPANEGATAGAAPGVGGITGSNVARSSTHSHTIAHTHNFAHTHGLSVDGHVHEVKDDTPGTGGANAFDALGNNMNQHTHYQQPYNAYVVDNAGATRSTGGFSAISNNNSLWGGNHQHYNPHTHWVNTHDHFTNTQPAGTGGSTNSQSTATTGGSSNGNSGDATVNVDVRNAATGLLKIMKVKHL
jgi:hypothetical protein